MMAMMGGHCHLRETAAKNQNWEKGIVIDWRGLCLKFIELLQPRWQPNSIFILKTPFPQNGLMRSSQF
jgi:hypothetical protein